MAKPTGWGLRRIAAGMLLWPILAVQQAPAQTAPIGNSANDSTRSRATTGSPVDTYRSLVAQGREALRVNDLPRAQQCCTQALSLGVTKDQLKFYDDTAEKLADDIRARGGNVVWGNGSAQRLPDNPKHLVKMGRDALQAGNFELAAECARRAEQVRPQPKWGLFDDSPSSLMRDTQSAKAKADKKESEVLLAKARALYEKRAANDVERKANLEQALQLAYKAERLHGPYEVWDLGDRPAKLIAQIDQAKVALRHVPSMPTPPTTTVSNTPGMMPETIRSTNVTGANSGAVQTAQATRPVDRPEFVTPVGNRTPESPPPLAPASGSSFVMPTTPGLAPAPQAVVDPNKAKASALCVEARTFVAAGRFAEAKAKVIEAMNLRVAFAPNEVSPDFVWQEMNATAARYIDSLLRSASAVAGNPNAAPEQRAKALGDVNKAKEVATTLGLYMPSVDETVSRLSAAPPVVAPTTPAPTTAQNSGGFVVPTAPTTPMMQPLQPVKPLAPSVGVAGTPNRNMGIELLRKAELELKRGETEAARRLATEAHAGNYGVQESAAAMIRTIDAEEFAQKKNNASRTFDSAVVEYRNANFRGALSMFEQIDPTLLPPVKANQMKDLMAQAAAQAAKMPTPTVRTNGGLQPAVPNTAPGIPAGVQAVAGSEPVKPTGPDNLARQVEAMQEVTFQKLRVEGLKVQSEAQTKFGKGETEAAIKMLESYLTAVKSAGLEKGQVALLSRPVELRIENFNLMKRHAEFFAKEQNDRSKFRSDMTRQAINEERKKEEVAKLMKEYHELMDQGKAREAEVLALKAHDLDPDNPATAAAVSIARTRYRQDNWDAIKARNENLFLEGLNEAHDPGPTVTQANPLHINREVALRNRDRSIYRDGVPIRNRSEKAREIQLKLAKPIATLDFNGVPLVQALKDLSVMTSMNIVPDTLALSEENISLSTPVTLQVNNISLKSALNLLLRQVRLTYAIEDEVLKVTTAKHAQGKMERRVFNVADLVIPIDNYAPHPTQQLNRVLERGNQNVLMSGVSPTPLSSPFGLPGGMPTGSSSVPGIDGAGRIINTGSVNNGRSPMSDAGTVATGKNTIEDQLIKLITNTIRPNSWSEVGGSGTIDYYPIGMALVVSQSSDVIQEVADLLEALRRLQDLEVSVEVRIISLAETFFERIGLDFSMNIRTSNSNFAPQVTTNSFAPEPFPNSINVNGVTTGLTPAGTFTPDLNIPIRSSSFQQAIPPFGGFPNMPGMNGGLSLGLAFLNDIQVYMFMEAAQGDRRTNVMQAPKITLFNGQTANLAVGDQQFFVTNVQVISVNGQIVFVPLNQAFPLNVQMTIQAVVSADRRFVRLNLIPTLTTLASATVPLFPITTFVTPVFEGGSQGQPIPFTQFIQQPTFQTINLQTTVNVPDGGTVLMGGLKTLSEGRNEFGPPVLSKVPYVNRLFKNVGYGREAQSLMLMVTPRIIINTEEEVRQTGEGEDALQQ